MELLDRSELERMTAPERLTLISELWDSLDGEQLPLSTAQKDELDERLATLGSDRSEGSTWESLRAELQSRP